MQFYILTLLIAVICNIVLAASGTNEKLLCKPSNGADFGLCVQSKSLAKFICLTLLLLCYDELITN